MSDYNNLNDLDQNQETTEINADETVVEETSLANNNDEITTDAEETSLNNENESANIAEETSLDKEDEATNMTEESSYNNNLETSSASSDFEEQRIVEQDDKPIIQVSKKGRRKTKSPGNKKTRKIVIVAVLVVSLLLSIILPSAIVPYVRNKHKIFVSSHLDFNKKTDGKTLFVLKKDIVFPSEDSTIPALNIDLNGHTIKTQGNLSWGTSTDVDLRIGFSANNSKKRIKEGVFVAKDFVIKARNFKSDSIINTENFRLTCASYNITNNLNAAASINLSSSSTATNANTIDAKLSLTPPSDATEPAKIFILGGYTKLFREQEHDFYLQGDLAVLETQKNSTVPSVYLSNNTTLIANNDILNIQGPSDLADPATNTSIAKLVSGTFNKVQYIGVLYDYIDNNVTYTCDSTVLKIKKYARLKTPMDAIIKSQDGKLICEFIASPGAGSYKIKVDGEEKPLVAEDVSATVKSFDITNVINETVSEHVILIWAIPKVDESDIFGESNPITITYAKKQPLDSPSIDIEVDADGRATGVITIHEVKSTQEFEILVNGLMLKVAAVAGSDTVVNIKEEFQKKDLGKFIGDFVLKVRAISSSKLFSPSPYVLCGLSMFGPYDAVSKDTMSLGQVSSDGTYCTLINWSEVPFANEYEIKIKKQSSEEHVFITKNTSLDLTSISSLRLESGDTVTITVLANGNYDKSSETTGTVNIVSGVASLTFS